LEFSALLPEIALLCLALLVFGLDLFSGGDKRRWLGWLAAVGLAVIFVLNLFWSWTGGELVFSGMLKPDLLALLFQETFIVAAILTVLISVDYEPLKWHGEYYGLVILATLGMNLMATAADLIMLYVALELTSITLYILAGYLRDIPKSSEAGLKYFLFGAFSSALMLYGMSLVYGLTGETGLKEVAVALATSNLQLPVILGALLLLAGFGFKIAAVPFHMWTPDVYEGAPTPVTAFVSVASKAAGFAVLMRVFIGAFDFIRPEWVAVVGALSVVTMTLGNVVAIPQTNIKRMLAYSSIAQAGYILIGVVCVSAFGVASTIFYLIMYTLTNICAFAVVVLISNVMGSDEITDFAGLSRRSPTLALVMLLALLSLGGIPPVAGFFGKLYIFAAAMEQGLVWLVVIGVLNAIISLYYYLIVARVMYLEEPPSEEPVPVPVLSTIVLLVTGLGVALMGFVSAPFLYWATRAAETFLAGL
jgi:NADH-quinone oxidoreductase subunit N